MSPIRVVAVSLALVTVAPLLTARVAAPVPDRPTGPTRLDFNGDPLPRGSTARLGAMRFRHGGNVSRIEFAPDGRTVYTACPTDRVVRVWSVADGREVRRFGGDRPLLTFDLSPDGARLITGEDGHLIRLWEAATGKEIGRIAADFPVADPARGSNQRLVPFVRFGADGTTAVAQYLGNVVIVWDLATRKQIRTWANERTNGTAALSRDGLRLALPDASQVRIVDVASGTTTRTIALSADQNNESHLAAFAMSPDGLALATAGADLTVRVWDVATGKETRQVPFPRRAHALAYSRDGSELAVAHSDGEEGTASVVNTGTGKVRRLEAKVHGVYSPTFSPDGRLLAFGDASHTLRLFDVATGNEIRPAAGHAGALTTIAVSPDGRLVATCSNKESAVRLWDAATGAEVRRLDGHATGVDEVTFSPDGKLLASAAWDQPVAIWDVASGRLVRKLEDHAALGAYLRFADDNRTLATGNHGNAIALWDCTTGKVVRDLASPPQGLASLLTFQDGRLIAYERPDADDDGEETIGLWDVTANRLVRRFAGHNARVNSVILSVDGRLLASRGTDKTIRVWEVATGAERLRFKEPGGIQQTGSWTGTQFLAFSPVDRLLVTAATDDPFARRWDLATRQELPPLAGHRGWVGAVEFAANGRVLVTGSQDTTALVWDAGAVLPAAAGGVVRRTDTEMAGFWEDLRGRDGAKAHAAIWALVGTGDEAVAFIGGRLRPTPPADDTQIARWIADLEREQFATRERATAALIQVADQAEFALRGALDRTRSAEVRQRVRRILDAASDADPSPERLQEQRAVEVLELIARPAAQQRLKALADGARGASLTREAQAALRRLTRRGTS